MRDDPALAGLPPIADLDRARWSPAAMAEAHAICGRLGLDLAAAVGTTTVPPGGLDSATLHRIGALTGVDRAISIVLGAQAAEWLRLTNSGPTFNGRAPATVIEQGGLGGLLAVRAFLDGWRGGCFAMAEGVEPEPVRLRTFGP